MVSNEVIESLAREVSSFLQVRRDSKEEAFLKAKASRNKSGSFKKGAINERAILILKEYGITTADLNSVIKSKKGKDQTKLDFQRGKYQAICSLIPTGEVCEGLQELKIEYADFVRSNNEEHKANVWLDEWAPKAEDISFATHVAKLTHSSSKSSSVLDLVQGSSEQYLTTSSLYSPIIDVASSNAASLPIADFLKISVEDTLGNRVSIIDCLKADDDRLVNLIVPESEIANRIIGELKCAFDSRQKKSFFLSKQTYFPIGGGEYHLLLPLRSSSLIQSLHLEYKSYFEEKQTKARKQRATKKYSTTELRSYPNKAVLNVTASNHSNASSLNGSRGGRITLLPTLPPHWRSSAPKISNNSLFNKALAFQLSGEIKQIQDYLLLIKSKQLSVTEPKRNAALINKLKELISSLFDYILEIGSNQNDGWTVDSQLPIEQQLLFEPNRQDEIAQQARLGKSWQKDISETFGFWLTRQLNKDAGLKLRPLHAELWSSHFANELREFIAIQEIIV